MEHHTAKSITLRSKQTEKLADSFIPETVRIRVLHGAASIKRNDHIEPVIHEILCIRFWQWQ